METSGGPGDGDRDAQDRRGEVEDDEADLRDIAARQADDEATQSDLLLEGEPGSHARAAEARRRTSARFDRMDAADERDAQARGRRHAAADRHELERIAQDAYTRRLLDYLTERGFTGAVARVEDIRADGIVLVPSHDQRFSDDQVASFGRLLRAFHDAGMGFEGVRGDDAHLKGDPGPRSTALVNGQPAVLIGLAEAGPGERLDDVAAGCWHWCLDPGVSEASDTDEQIRQLRVLSDAYGLRPDARAEVAQHIREAQSREVVRVAIELSREDLSEDEHSAIRLEFVGLLEDRDFLRDNLDAIKAALR